MSVSASCWAAPSDSWESLSTCSILVFYLDKARDGSLSLPGAPCPPTGGVQVRWETSQSSSLQCSPVPDMCLQARSKAGADGEGASWGPRFLPSPPGFPILYFPSPTPSSVRVQGVATVGEGKEEAASFPVFARGPGVSCALKGGRKREKGHFRLVLPTDRDKSAGPGSCGSL